MAGSQLGYSTVWEEAPDLSLPIKLAAKFIFVDSGTIAKYRIHLIIYPICAESHVSSQEPGWMYYETNELKLHGL